MKTNQTQTPVWGTIQGAAIRSGLSKSTIINLLKAEHVRSAKVVIAGNKFGRRLVDLASLDAFIEQHVGK